MRARASTDGDGNMPFGMRSLVGCLCCLAQGDRKGPLLSPAPLPPLL